MIEKYFGCFYDGSCRVYGYAIRDENNFIVSGNKLGLLPLIAMHGLLIAKWTVRFKTKTI